MQKIHRLPGERWSDYRSRLGREMESRVYAQLKRLEVLGVIHNVRQHTNYEPEDLAGADFTVGIRQRDGDIVDCRFGITISRRRHVLTMRRHPDVFNLHLPASLNANQVHERLFRFIATRVKGSYLVYRKNREMLLQRQNETIDWL